MSLSGIVLKTGVIFGCILIRNDLGTKPSKSDENENSIYHNWIFSLFWFFFSWKCSSDEMYICVSVERVFVWNNNVLVVVMCFIQLSGGYSVVLGEVVILRCISLNSSVI